jgi:hypothetical protein
VAGLAVTAPASFAQMAIPAEPGGWGLQILTRGGIMGKGAGEILMISDGRLSCQRPNGGCVPTVTPAALRSLQEQIHVAANGPWQVLRPASICSDCLITDLVLTTRANDGSLITQRASWDPTTRRQQVPAIVQLHDLVTQLAQPLTR